jgi:Patatin-like phospholipase
MRRADFLRGTIAASATVNAATEPARGQALTTDVRAPRRALILSGGGSRGVYQAAVAVALARGAGLKDGEPLPYDLIRGTSIGALNGYLIGTAQYRRLEEVWSRIPSLPVGTLKTPYNKIRDSSAGIANRLTAALKRDAFWGQHRALGLLCSTPWTRAENVVAERSPWPPRSRYGPHVAALGRTSDCTADRRERQAKEPHPTG